MTLEEFIDRAMFVPFRSHGRSYRGWDCWGLFYLAYRDIYDIELPSYRKEYKSIKDCGKLKELIKMGLEDMWKPTTYPKEGNSVIIYHEGREIHVGMMISKDRVIHTDAGVNTCIQKLTDFRIEGIYRYNGK